MGNFIEKMKVAPVQQKGKNMKNENIVKVITTTIGSFLSSILGILYVPVLLLIVCNLIDYATGLMAAPQREDGKVSSYKSIRGIFKKVAMWLLIVVGAVVDKLLMYTATTLGFTWSITYLIAAFVAVWLICNELISILENLKDIGVPMPAFLMPIVKNIAKKTEETLNVEEEEHNHDERN